MIEGNYIFLKVKHIDGIVKQNDGKKKQQKNWFANWSAIAVVAVVGKMQNIRHEATHTNSLSVYLSICSYFFVQFIYLLIYIYTLDDEYVLEPN